jgi:ParB/RepB/Spo0J family partition protein
MGKWTPDGTPGFTAKHALKGIDGFMGRGDIFRVNPQAIKVMGGWNPRKIFTGIEELRDSIISEGVKRPIEIYKTKDGVLELRDGERRLRATLMAIAEGYPIESIPALIVKKGTSESDQLIGALVANTGEPLTATDQAAGFRRLRNWGVSVVDIAKRVGVSETMVRERLELANVAPVVSKAVDAGVVSIKEARKISKDADGKMEPQAEAIKKKTAEAKTPKKKTRVINYVNTPGGLLVSGALADKKCQAVSSLFENPEFQTLLLKDGFDINTLKITVQEVCNG